MYTEMFQTIQDTLIKKVDPVFIIIFGTNAKNTTRKDSDITYEVFQLA